MNKSRFKQDAKYLCAMKRNIKTEKGMKIRHIGRISGNFSRFTPISENTQRGMYDILTIKFENFTRWPETSKMTRKEFESSLKGKEDLIDAYLDVYSKEADFYLCKIASNQTILHYCIMYVNKKIVLLYYRKIEYDFD